MTPTLNVMKVSTEPDLKTSKWICLIFFVLTKETMYITRIIEMGQEAFLRYTTNLAFNFCPKQTQTEHGKDTI